MYTKIVFLIMSALAAGCATDGELMIQRASIEAQRDVALARIHADKEVALATRSTSVSAPMIVQASSPAPAIVVPQVESGASRWAQVLMPALGFAGQVVGAVYSSRAAMRQSDNATLASIAATTAQRDQTIASYTAASTTAGHYAASNTAAFSSLARLADRPIAVVAPAPNITTTNAYSLTGGSMGNFGNGTFTGPVTTTTNTTRICTGGNGAPTTGTTGNPVSGPGGAANC